MVLGDSMEPEFVEREIIVVEPEGLATDGSYVIAFHNEEYIFRQLIKREAGWALHALNPGLPRSPDRQPVRRQGRGHHEKEARSTQQIRKKILCRQRERLTERWGWTPQLAAVADRKAKQRSMSRVRVISTHAGTRGLSSRLTNPISR